jgi:hypothetical protein
MPASLRTLRFAPDVVLRATSEEALLLKLGQETVFALNATAARVATLVQKGQSLEQIIDCLSTEYERPPADISIDVRELVMTLIDSGLLIDAEQA